ncbi:DUF1684 domain-containing protein [Hamadaea tsunoensis]|uniref:DUF1684 domain-containing protein n=1 Tax=Hamadaea tsunoensis TaxID=53368 RepID=UPI00040BCDE7|nr:DUF1684 domain-containing protein [Hamadaea tsunoensis]
MTNEYADWERWRSARADLLRDPHGPLSFRSLHWLGEQAEAYPPIPGKWSAGPAGVTVDSADGLLADGLPLVGSVTLTPDENGATVLGFEDKLVDVLRRTGRYALRLRDPGAPALKAFTGVPSYPFDPRWVLDATFVPSASSYVGASIVDGHTPTHRVRGRIQFTVDCAERSVLAFDAGPSAVQVLLRDATSGVTTYGGVRSLIAEVPPDGGALRLDFNRAANLPCAFTEFSTCPLPPPENILPFAVEAGEQLPSAA